MRKLILLSLLLSLSIGLLCADVARGLYLEYINDQNTENFMVAYSYFSEIAETDTTQRDMMHFYLMNMHQLEATRYLLYLIENVDRLSAGMRRGIADALVAQGQLEQAVEMYKKAIEESPEWSCAWKHKADTYLKMNDLANAESALRTTIEISPNHYYAHVTLADVLHRQGKNGEALVFIEEGFAILDDAHLCEEERYTDVEVQFLYLQILQANRSRRSDARRLEADLRAQHPNHHFWNR